VIATCWRGFLEHEYQAFERQDQEPLACTGILAGQKQLRCTCIAAHPAIAATIKASKKCLNGKQI